MLSMTTRCCRYSFYFIFTNLVMYSDFISMYSSTPLKRPLPPKATLLIWPFTSKATLLILPFTSKATLLIWPFTSKATSLIRSLPLKATPLIRPDFRCTELVKYYSIVPLKRVHPSFKDTFSLQKLQISNLVHISRITFIRYAQSQKIGNLNI